MWYSHPVLLISLLTMHKIRITQNFVEEYYLLIIVKLQHVLASPLGHHRIVKQNVCFTYTGERTGSISHCVKQ